jgi:hypothetical protein
MFTGEAYISKCGSRRFRWKRTIPWIFERPAGAVGNETGTKSLHSPGRRTSTRESSSIAAAPAARSMWTVSGTVAVSGVLRNGFTGPETYVSILSSYTSTGIVRPPSPFARARRSEV